MASCVAGFVSPQEGTACFSERDISVAVRVQLPSSVRPQVVIPEALTHDVSGHASNTVCLITDLASVAFIRSLPTMVQDGCPACHLLMPPAHRP